MDEREAEARQRLRQRMCGAKTQFTSKAKADGFITNLIKQNKLDGHIESYECEFCHYWHVGHVPKRSDWRTR